MESFDSGQDHKEEEVDHTNVSHFINSSKLNFCIFFLVVAEFKWGQYS